MLKTRSIRYFFIIKLKKYFLHRTYTIQFLFQV